MYSSAKNAETGAVPEEQNPVRYWTKMPTASASTLSPSYESNILIIFISLAAIWPIFSKLIHFQFILKATEMLAVLVQKLGCKTGGKVRKPTASCRDHNEIAAGPTAVVEGQTGIHRRLQQQGRPKKQGSQQRQLRQQNQGHNSNSRNSVKEPIRQSRREWRTDVNSRRNACNGRDTCKSATVRNQQQFQQLHGCQ